MVIGFTRLGDNLQKITGGVLKPPFADPPRRKSEMHTMTSTTRPEFKLLLAGAPQLQRANGKKLL
jgi:hypothetical protein